MREKKKSIFKRKWFWIVIAVVIVVGVGGNLIDGGFSDDSSTSNDGSKQVSKKSAAKADSKDQDQSKESDKKKDNPKKSKNQKIKDAVKKAYEGDVKKTKIENIKGKKQVTATMKLRENFTANMSKKTALDDSKKIFKAIYQIKKINAVTLKYDTTLTDEYGKDSNETVIHIMILPKTAKKINWDNFNSKNFKNIADGYGVHPSLKK